MAPNTTTTPISVHLRAVRTGAYQGRSAPVASPTAGQGTPPVMSDAADGMQERLDEVEEHIDEVRRNADHDVPGLDLDPTDRYTEPERRFVDSGSRSRADDDRGPDSKEDDQTIVPPG